jgi:hypothetical protein
VASEAQLTTWKDEAEVALHRLMTGSMVEEISGPNNTKTRFMPADLEKLQAYIGYLEGLISTASTGFRRRPIYFTPDLG